MGELWVCHQRNNNAESLGLLRQIWAQYLWVRSQVVIPQSTMYDQCHFSLIGEQGSYEHAQTRHIVVIMSSSSSSSLPSSSSLLSESKSSSRPCHRDNRRCRHRRCWCLVALRPKLLSCCQLNPPCTFMPHYHLRRACTTGGDFGNNQACFENNGHNRLPNAYKNYAETEEDNSYEVKLWPMNPHLYTSQEPLVPPCVWEFNRARGRGWESQPLLRVCFRVCLKAALDTLEPQSRGWTS